MLGAFLNWSPPYSLRHGLSLALQLADSTGQSGQWAPGSSCLSSPGVMWVCQCVSVSVFLVFLWGFWVIRFWYSCFHSKHFSSSFVHILLLLHRSENSINGLTQSITNKSTVTLWHQECFGPNLKDTACDSSDIFVAFLWEGQGLKPQFTASTFLW